MVPSDPLSQQWISWGLYRHYHTPQTFDF
jgi:hypothetical protein